MNSNRSCTSCEHYGNRDTLEGVGPCLSRGYLVVAHYDAPRCHVFSAVPPGGAFSSSGAVAPLESPVYRTPLIQAQG